MWSGLVTRVSRIPAKESIIWTALILAAFLSRVRRKPYTKRPSVNIVVTGLLRQILLPFRVIPIPLSKEQIFRTVITVSSRLTLAKSSIRDSS